MEKDSVPAADGAEEDVASQGNAGAKEDLERFHAEGEGGAGQEDDEIGGGRPEPGEGKHGPLRGQVGEDPEVEDRPGRLGERRILDPRRAKKRLPPDGEFRQGTDRVQRVDVRSHQHEGVRGEGEEQGVSAKSPARLLFRRLFDHPQRRPCRDGAEKGAEGVGADVDQGRGAGREKALRRFDDDAEEHPEKGGGKDGSIRRDPLGPMEEQERAEGEEEDHVEDDVLFLGQLPMAIGKTGRGKQPRRNGSPIEPEVVRPHRGVQDDRPAEDQEPEDLLPGKSDHSGIIADGMRRPNPANPRTGTFMETTELPQNWGRHANRDVPENSRRTGTDIESNPDT